MLEQLKEQYKELGKARTEFGNNVNKTFIALYDRLIEECSENLFDITISTNYLNRFVNVKISIHNLNQVSEQQFEKSKFIEFDEKRISFYLADIDTSEIKKNEILNNKQLTTVIEITRFLFNFYFYLNIKNKNIENESIDWLVDEVSKSLDNKSLDNKSLDNKSLDNK